ncbi:MAG: flagellar hook-basal body protein [Bdellovibrionota bacterium]
MDRGLYVATSGGLYSSRRVDVVANNIANVNTVGYKAERLVGRQQEFSDTLASVLPETARAKDDHARTPGVVHMSTVTDFTQGAIDYTGNPLNAALQNQNEFFVVQTPQGEAYTKAGNFTLNSEGFIVTPDGKPVMGEGGPIAVNGGLPKIEGNGAVFVGKEQVGKLRIAQFQDLKTLKRTDGTRFTLGPGGQPPSTAESPTLIPGAVETANIQVVEAIVDLINAQKSFEAYGKSVQTIGELNDLSLRTARTG